MFLSTSTSKGSIAPAAGEYQSNNIFCKFVLLVMFARHDFVEAATKAQAGFYKSVQLNWGRTVSLDQTRLSVKAQNQRI